MVLRLSELLERIRPAGTPGAAMGGERRGLAAVEEIDAIAREVERYRAEAHDIIVAAESTADEIRQGAQERARRARADVPDQIAVVTASITQAEQTRTDDELIAIADRTAHRLDELTSRAETMVPSLVAAALESIWSAFAPEPERSG